MKKILKFFDVLEDRVRARLSRHPLVYGMVSGLGIVLFYRGVWMVADLIPFLNAWITLAISVFALMISGVFVSQFVSNSIILSGIKREKKIVERVSTEVQGEFSTINEIRDELRSIRKELEELRARDMVVPK